MNSGERPWRCRDVGDRLDEWAPASLAGDWDNVGWMMGDPDAPLAGVLVSLDLTQDILNQAVSLGVNLVVTHHPPIFPSLRSVTADTWEGRLAGRCWREGLAVFSAHTNFDAAPGGLADELANRLGLIGTQPFPEPGMPGPVGLARVGSLPEAMTPEAFCASLSRCLPHAFLRLVGEAPNQVTRVAVQNGAYERELLPSLARVPPDVLVTGDVRHHDALALSEAGLFAVDAGHQATELPFCRLVGAWLENTFPGLPVHIAREAPVYRAP